MFEYVLNEELEHQFQKDPELRRMYYHHRELDKKIEEAEHGVLPLSDKELHEMKIERLHLKEKISLIWPEGFSKSSQ